MRLSMASVSALALFPFADVAFAEPTVTERMRPEIEQKIEQTTKMFGAVAQPAGALLEMQLQARSYGPALDYLSAETAQERAALRIRRH